MSSHREAPAISKDPVADNTDTYAFVSPDVPGTVTIITNYLPLEPPFGGPNFYEFGDDVLYDINVDNDGDGYPDVVYSFSFETQVVNPNTFLYNTGPIDSISSGNWNRRQFYTVTRSTPHNRGRRWCGGGEGWRSEVIASGLACPPCNIGPASTPDYAALASEAIHTLGGRRTVFAGQRLEGFYVDLGAIFDLGDLRPFEKLHLAGMANSVGVNSTNEMGVHSIALRVPMSDLTRSGRMPKDPTSADSVIGVWGSASRQRTTIREDGGTTSEFGEWVQISRLGNPLFNEVIVPMGKKDLWNSLTPADDRAFLNDVQHPELAGLLPVLYPGVFPNLAALTAARADLVAILLTGLPSGVVPGFQNYTGSTYADELRLNMAIPATVKNPNPVGLVAGDPAGFPNGRRVFDDVVSIELRAIAGLTYPLVMPTYAPDAAASAITDGLTDADTTYLSSFPYLGTPQSGYQTAPLGLVA
jgi:hypothetical protein